MGGDDQAFLALSRVLTGYDDLAPPLAWGRLAQLRGRPDICPALGSILEAVAACADAAAVEVAVETWWADPGFAPSLRSILLLWFSGGFYPADVDARSARLGCAFGTDRESGYVSGLVWRARSARGSIRT